MAKRSSAHAPVRTCVGCRARAAKSDLLRLVGRDGQIVPDPQARLPGRGAYLHPSRDCFERAQRRNAFGRALRGPAQAGTLGHVLAQWCEEPHPGASRPASRGGETAAYNAGKAGSDGDERPMRTRR